MLRPGLAMTQAVAVLGNCACFLALTVFLFSATRSVDKTSRLAPLPSTSIDRQSKQAISGSSGTPNATWKQHRHTNCFRGHGALEYAGEGQSKLFVADHDECIETCRQRGSSACTAVVLGWDRKLQRQGIKFVCWLRAAVDLEACVGSSRYDTYVRRQPRRASNAAPVVWPPPPPPPPWVVEFAARAEWALDETHACRNLSGIWAPAAPALAAQYAATGLVEGAVWSLWPTVRLALALTLILTLTLTLTLSSVWPTACVGQHVHTLTLDEPLTNP